MRYFTPALPEAGAGRERADGAGVGDAGGLGVDDAGVGGVDDARGLGADDAGVGGVDSAGAAGVDDFAGADGLGGFGVTGADGGGICAGTGGGVGGAGAGDGPAAELASSSSARGIGKTILKLTSFQDCVLDRRQNPNTVRTPLALSNSASVSKVASVPRITLASVTAMIRR